MKEFMWEFREEELLFNIDSRFYLKKKKFLIIFGELIIKKNIIS
jgi:hypothetical protein